MESFALTVTVLDFARLAWYANHHLKPKTYTSHPHNQQW